MATLISKRYKWIAILLGIVLIAEISLYSLRAVGQDSSVAGADSDGNNQQIAADISNMTGVDTEQILKLKASGLTWNEIIEYLKNSHKTDVQQGKEDRSLLLMNTGLDEQAIERFKAEGYTEQEITDAKLLAERVAFQLRELVQPDLMEAPEPAADIFGKRNEDQTEQFESFRTVADQFDLETAIRLMLGLRDDFGSMEAAFDEYLLALQLGLNLDDYVLDKEKYMQDKESKRIEKVGAIVVSMAEIERSLLEKLQKNNANQLDELPVVQSVHPGQSGISEQDNPLPDVTLPKVKDVKPVNPADAIMDEINAINPNKESAQ